MMSSRFDDRAIERIAAEAYREDQAESDAGEKRDQGIEHVEAVRTNFAWIAAGTMAVALFATVWYTTRAPEPSDAELAAAHERMLRLAGQVVRESIDHEGHPPASMAKVLPAAAAVQIKVVDGGVDLLMVNKGGTSKLFIPMEAAGP